MYGECTARCTDMLDLISESVLQPSSEQIEVITGAFRNPPQAREHGINSFVFVHPELIQTPYIVAKLFLQCIYRSGEDLIITSSGGEGKIC